MKPIDPAKGTNGTQLLRDVTWDHLEKAFLRLRLRFPHGVQAGIERTGAAGYNVFVIDHRGGAPTSGVKGLYSKETSVYRVQLLAKPDQGPEKLCCLIERGITLAALKVGLRGEEWAIQQRSVSGYLDAVHYTNVLTKAPVVKQPTEGGRKNNRNGPHLGKVLLPLGPKEE